MLVNLFSQNATMKHYLKRKNDVSESKILGEINISGLDFRLFSKFQRSKRRSSFFSVYTGDSVSRGTLLKRTQVQYSP